MSVSRVPKLRENSSPGRGLASRRYTIRLLALLRLSSRIAKYDSGIQRKNVKCQMLQNETTRAGVGKRCELPQRGPGGSLAAKRFSCNLKSS